MTVNLIILICLNTQFIVVKSARGGEALGKPLPFVNLSSHLEETNVVKDQFCF